MNNTILALTFTEWLKDNGLAGKQGGDLLNEYGVVIIIVVTLLGIASAIIKMIGAFAKTSTIPTTHVPKLLNRLITLAFVVVFLSFVSLVLFQVLYAATKASSPVVPPAIPGPTTGVVAPPPAATTEYKLIWFNHFEPGMLYEVDATKVQNKDKIGNDEFRSWCKPFIQGQHQIVNRWLVAAHEDFQEVPGKGRENWWTSEKYNSLAPLRKRWLEIMDDESWYVYEVVRANP